VTPITSPDSLPNLSIQKCLMMDDVYSFDKDKCNPWNEYGLLTSISIHDTKFWPSTAELSRKRSMKSLCFGVIPTSFIATLPE